MGAPSVLVIVRSVCIREDCHGEIEIERVDAEIDLVDVDDTHADVVLGCFYETCWGTDNLPVKKSAINSRFATEHDEKRFVLGRGEFPGLLQIRQPGKPLCSARFTNRQESEKESDEYLKGFHLTQAIDNRPRSMLSLIWSFSGLYCGHFQADASFAFRIVRYQM